MSTPSLSVCIPTYNFGRFIGETLDSILPRITGEVEVLVVDGASTDNTGEVVRSRQERFPMLRYHRLEKKGGIDRDMAKSVEMARGEYVWLFSADDCMAAGAPGKVLEEIRQGLDLYLCGFTLCDFDMRPQRRHPILDTPDGSTYDLGNPRERKDYFERGLTTTAFFSYMSSLVIRKEKWNCAEMDDSFVGSCWDHVARIFGMIPSGLRVKYLQEPQFFNRGGNDSFLDRGHVHRIGIAVNGYHRIADTFFGDTSLEAFHIRRVLRNEYTLPYLLYTKWMTHSNPGTEDRETLDLLVEKLYRDFRPADLVKLLSYRWTPVSALDIAEKVLRQRRATPGKTR